MDERTIRTVPGYGASLRQQLEAIGWTQGRLASESSASRQTVSRAINRDEVSDRTRARLDAALRRAPARRRSNRRHGVGSVVPVLGRALCDGTDLVAWADRRAAQSLLPLAIRRLVQATGLGVSKLTMRTGEGVHLSGWDGIVHADRGSTFVPKGASGWEMSVGRNPGVKAEENWEKRTKAPGALVASETTFVFVTPRRWPGKEEWAARKMDDSPWRDVRVLDADDLAAWLEEAPVVHTWLSIQIGKIPSDTRDLKSYWEHWAGATRPALTRRFLLSRWKESVDVTQRESVADLHQRLSDMGGQVCAIQAESRSEAIAWLYCAIRELGTEQAEPVLTRCLVVESAEGFQHLVAAKSPLVLVPSFHPEELAAAAVRAGHMVVVPLDEAAPGHADDLVRLGPLCRQSTADALRDVGIDHDRAYEMAGLARRSLTALRRSLAVAPGFRQPEWSRPAVGRGLLPALLVGSWRGRRDSNPDDRDVISSLARKPYEEVADSLYKWSIGSDPLVRHRDGAWYLVSAQDAWRLLCRYIMQDDLDRFENAATTVLGSVHPAFELPAEQRWMAGALGYSGQYSRFLSDGLVRTLAIMGVHGADVPSAMFSARDTSGRVVHTLLEKANRDWRLWASLSTRLRLLAEAAPDHFLDAVEAGLEGPEPTLAGLFASYGHPMFGSEYHTELLTALEVLAWSPDHLGRVVPLLARLDHVDPESEVRLAEGERSRVAHRPLAVLKALFRSWLPQTSASLDERLAVLDRLRVSHDKAAWRVMCSMLPELHSVGHPTARPSVREWTVDAWTPLGRDEQARTISEVVQRMLDDVGSSGSRWAKLLGHLHMMPRGEHDRVVAALRDLDPAELGVEVRSAIWEALRGIVARHRDYRTAKWAMPEKYVARLAEIRDGLAPEAPVSLHAWLFTHRPPHVGAGDAGETPRKVRKQRLARERVKAVRAIVQRSGLSGLVELANAVENPYELGFAAASCPAALLQPDDLLPCYLADARHPMARLASGYAWGCAHHRGDDWVIRQLEREELQLTADQRLELLLVLPECASTWRLVAAHGEDIARRYWRGITPRYIKDEHLAEAVAGLVEAGRPFAAADLLAFDKRVTNGLVPADLVARLLDAAASTSGQQESPGADFGSCAGFLLDALKRADYDQSLLARLEWRLMPALSHHERAPDALHRLMSEDPEFFVEVLSLVYRGESEEPADVSVQDEMRAESGYSLLASWRSIPGSADGGDINQARLREWLDQAESALETAGRITIGHQMIGQMFSSSTTDPDGTWPCAPVREVIEDLASTDLERGFAMGVFNGRGVVMKDPSSGGAAERALADQYQGFAAAIRSTHPRTARMLREIAKEYRLHASREDFESVMIEEL